MSGAQFMPPLSRLPRSDTRNTAASTMTNSSSQFTGLHAPDGLQPGRCEIVGVHYRGQA